MKFAFICPDGAADHPLPSLDGKTPLEAAATPNMDRVAREGVLGLARTIPAGLPAGSDVGQLSLLGYDPDTYFTGGRAPIEAAALGIRLGPDDVAFRLNLVRVEDGRMADYSGGHISTEKARPIVEAIAKALDSERWSFHPGVQYRHIFRWDGYGKDRALPKTRPPHDITSQEIEKHLPSGEAAQDLLAIMDRTRAIVPGFESEATQGWIWSGGRAPSLPTIAERFRGVRGAAISAVDIVRGLATLAGLRVLTVPGATGYYDTDYAAKGRAAMETLAGPTDFVYVHIEAPDEATHSGLLEKKIEAIERIDRDIVGPILAALEKAGEPFRVLIAPDHATTLATKTHAPDPVPFALLGAGVRPAGAVAYNERAARIAHGAQTDPVPGHELIERLFKPWN